MKYSAIFIGVLLMGLIYMWIRGERSSVWVSTIVLLGVITLVTHIGYMCIQYMRVLS